MADGGVCHHLVSAAHAERVEDEWRSLHGEATHRTT